jgi:hypothetical protein
MALAANGRCVTGSGLIQARQQPSIISPSIFRFRPISPLVRDSIPGTKPGSTANEDVGEWVHLAREGR